MTSIPVNPGTALPAKPHRASRASGPRRATPTTQVVYRRASRAANVLLAAIGLVLTAPIIFATAVLVALSSKGPLFYSQVRVGIDRRNRRSGNSHPRRRVDFGGKPFRIYKFRTMFVNNAEAKSARWATPDDPRVTPVGRWLRRSRLDELPQLFNVLRGDMNIVGPRPEQPGIFRQLNQQIDGYGNRQRVAPGITGLAQINLDYDQSIDDVRRKVAFDLQYIEQRSVLGDLKIMARTVPVVLFRRGAI